MITLTAKITLDDKTTYDVDKRNMLSFNVGIIDRGDTVLPSFGIISNGGNFEIVDYDGRIKLWVESLKLNSKTKVNIFLNDTISKTNTQIGDFFASKWDYDNDAKTARAELTDGLEQMQDINITPLVYDLSREEGTKKGIADTAEVIYEFLQKQTVKNGFDMISTSDLDAKTREHLKNISIAYPYIKQMNLWRAWQDFAVAFQLHIYKNRQGKIVCVYRGGD